jgi:hypothetical protein
MTSIHNFYIFSDQALSKKKNNPWRLLKLAIERGMLDGSKFTFFGELSKDNINKIKRRPKTDRPALMIVDDKADELGKAPFSLIDARHEHTLHCHVWIMAQQFVFSGGEGIPSQIARQTKWPDNHRGESAIHFHFQQAKATTTTTSDQQNDVLSNYFQQLRLVRVRAVPRRLFWVRQQPRPARHRWPVL